MTDTAESAEESQDSNLPRPYRDAIEGYLSAAKHLDALDEPLKVHARALARSLDGQLNTKGEIQSALASSFDKVMMRLDARRPKPATEAPQMTGQTSIFDSPFGD